MSARSFINGLVLVLFFVSANALAYEEKAPCPVEQSLDARTKFKALYEEGKYVEAETFLAEYIDECSAGMYRDIEPRYLRYWLVSDLMMVQRKTGHLNECLSRGLGTIYKWGWGEEETDKEQSDKAWSALRSNMEKCRSDILSLRGIKFSSMKCPVAGYESATAIPHSWGLSDVEGMCVYLYPGTVGINEEDDTKVDYSHLVLLKSDGKGGHLEQKLLFEGADFGGCGNLKVRLGGNPESRMILLTGTQGFCWAGTGAWALDVVYRLKSTTAVFVTGESFSVH